MLSLKELLTNTFKMCENEFLDSLDVFDAERKSVEQPPLMAATDKSSCRLNKKRKNTNEGVLLAFTWREKASLSSQTHVWVFLQSRQCGGEKKPAWCSHCPAGVKHCCVVCGLQSLLKCGFAPVSLPAFVLINDAAISWATKQNKFKKK